MKLQAAIVETRELKNIREIVDGHLKFLPHGIQTVFFHSEGNYEFLRRELKGIDVKYVKISASSLSASAYNHLLTQKKFWEMFDAEKILIFQHDSRLLRTGIEEFYPLDFVGAPLYHIDFPAMNGGLSLRGKDAMLKILTNYTYNENHHGNEDIFFTSHLRMSGGKLATRQEADRFACETIYTLGTLGCHAIEKYLNRENCYEIITQYNN